MLGGLLLLRDPVEGCDGAVQLGLALGEGGVGLGEEEGRADLLRASQEEAAGGDQLAVALGVGEGVAGAPGADTSDWGPARSRSRQRLLTHLVSHLEEEGDGGEERGGGGRGRGGERRREREEGKRGRWEKMRRKIIKAVGSLHTFVIVS